MLETTDEKLDTTLQCIAPPWDAGRTESNLRLVRRRLQRRGRVRLAAFAALVAAAATAGVFLLLAPKPRPASRAVLVTQDADARVIRFSDGSVARLLDEHSQVEVASVDEHAIELRLASGRSEFDVVPGRNRTFTVTVDATVVRVLGTRFQLEREGRHVRVAVARGKVEVRWPGGVRVLGEGQSGRYPEEGVAPPSAPLADAQASPEPAASSAATGSAQGEPPAVSAAARRHFRDLAVRGRYADAYRVLVAGSGVLDGDVEELMLAADSARLSGHPAAATPYLERILRKHRQDPQAPLAAFTLGRILLQELGRPAEAADAFAAARSLRPDGPLAADALAREAEAASRADQRDRARTRAKEYEALYPSGRRLEAVRRYGRSE